MIARNILITDAGFEPVTDQAALDHLREDVANQARVRTYLTAARHSIEQELIALKTTQSTYEVQMDTWEDLVDWCGYITLPACPLVSITSIKYDDIGNVEQTLSSTNYQLDTASRPGRIRYTAAATLPSTYDKPNAIRIRYVAGHGATSAGDGGQSAVPGAIKSAILLRCAELWEVRSESIGGMQTPAPSATVERLLAPFRIPV